MSQQRAAPPDGPPVLLLTRPEAASRRFAAEVRALAPGDWRAVIAPLLRIVPLADPAAPEGVPVFTSAHAVPFAGPGGGAPAWCVGPRTAEAARRAGWAPCEGGTGGDVEALLGAILSAPPAPVVHLRGVHTRGRLAARLRAAGRPASERVVYDQVARPLTDAARGALAGAAPVIAPVFSPRSAALLAEAVGNPAAPFRVIAVSAAAAEPLRRWSPVVAARPDGPAMAEATAALLR